MLHEWLMRQRTRNSVGILHQSSLVSAVTLGKEAALHQKLPSRRVRCTACARYRNIPEGKIGSCGIGGDVDGRLQLFVYGYAIAGHTLSTNDLAGASDVA